MKLPAYHPFRTARAKEQYLAAYDRRAQQWPVASETRMVETSYGQTFVRISGATHAQPLVLLPGAAASSLMWLPVIATLSASYQTYAVDNIYDAGRSVYTRPLKTPDDFVSWLDELFTALVLGDHINLMGISYGGWLTSLYALRFPNRLAKIVLVAPGATVLPLRWELWLRSLLAAPHPRFLKRFFLDWLLGSGGYKDHVTQKRVAEGIEDIVLGWRSLKFKIPPLPPVLADEALRGLQVPALYLVGEHEKIYSAPKAIQRLKTVAPQIKTEIIPGAGHDLILVQPEAVNRKVLEFLA